LEKLTEQLDCVGFRKYVVDAVVDPPLVGLLDSFSAYAEFRRRFPKVPMMAGVGNVTEMIDADSPGVNAILAAFCAEAGVDLLFTVEASSKTRGCVRELSSAAEIMYLAKERKQPPKDLSRTLLVLKDKRRPDGVKEEKAAVPEVAVPASLPKDVLEESFFRINVSDRIEAVYYLRDKPKLRFVGSSAEAVYKEIFSRKLVKSLSHAAYLGRELAKAEIALKLGKNYVQDTELF
jgi:dihydropteroate synthase-like protein